MLILNRNKKNKYFFKLCCTIEKSLYLCTRKTQGNRFLSLMEA